MASLVGHVVLITEGKVEEHMERFMHTYYVHSIVISQGADGEHADDDGCACACLCEA